MQDVKSVWFNNGADDLFALVKHDHGSGLLDLIVFEFPGTPSLHTSVPRRERKDYGPEGGGRTWHSSTAG